MKKRIDDKVTDYCYTFCDEISDFQSNFFKSLPKSINKYKFEIIRTTYIAVICSAIDSLNETQETKNKIYDEVIKDIVKLKNVFGGFGDFSSHESIN